MAKKRKRNSKTNKVQRNIKSEDFIVNSMTSCKVAVPDFPYRAKRKQQPGAELFVNASCINYEISSPLILLGNQVVPKESKEYQSKGSKRKPVGAQVPFVPSSCITNSTTPVIHFCYKKDAERSMEKTHSKKTAREKRSASFVSKGCLTTKVLLPNIEPQYSYPEPIALSKTYDIVLERRVRRQKSTNIGAFVSCDCITNSVTPVYCNSNFDLQPLVNPYPALLDLAPDIITSSAKKNRTKANCSAAFVPTSCIIGDGVKTPDPPLLKMAAPLVKYQYIERPNSPDIHGPVIKKTRRRRNNIVAFVPKSCTVVEKKIPDAFISKGDVLARTRVKTVPTDAPKTNRLSLIMFALVLLVLFAIYLKLIS